MDIFMVEIDRFLIGMGVSGYGEKAAEGLKGKDRSATNE